MKPRTTSTNIMVLPLASARRPVVVSARRAAVLEGSAPAGKRVGRGPEARPPGRAGGSGGGKPALPGLMPGGESADQTEEISRLGADRYHPTQGFTRWRHAS